MCECVCVCVCVCGCVLSCYACVIWAAVKEVRVGKIHMCTNNCNMNIFLITMMHFVKLVSPLLPIPTLQRIRGTDAVVKLWRDIFSGAAGWQVKVRQGLVRVALQ